VSRYVPERVEDRIRIIHWLLAWAKERGVVIWCDDNIIRYSDDGGFTRKAMDWYRARSIAAAQQIKSTGVPVKRTARKQRPVVYPRVAHRYSKQKEKQ
jgi:hypothetical protein